MNQTFPFLTQTKCNQVIKMFNLKFNELMKKKPLHMMKKTVGILIIAFFSIASTLNGWSQNEFSFHAGLALPMGDFASDDEDDYNALGAGTGFNFGFKYLHPFTNSPLGYFIGADFFYNGLKKSIKDDTEDLLEDMNLPSVDITYSKFINIPVLTGLNLTVDAGENLMIFGEAGVGIDYFKITDLTASSVQKVEIIYGSSTKFAYRIGAGLKINKKYLLNVNYNGLGTHNFKPKIKVGYQSETLDRIKPKTDVVSITLGIIF